MTDLPTILSRYCEELGGRWSPCPVCFACTTRHDRRGCIRIGAGRWHCAACGASGDALNFVAWTLRGEPPPPRGDPRWRHSEWREVVEEVSR